VFFFEDFLWWDGDWLGSDGGWDAFGLMKVMITGLAANNDTL
jgi:hypothetical protein